MVVRWTVSSSPRLVFGSPQRGSGSSGGTAAMEGSLSKAGQEGDGGPSWAAHVQVCVMVLLPGLTQKTKCCIHICFLAISKNKQILKSN